MATDPPDSGIDIKYPRLTTVGGLGDIGQDNLSTSQVFVMEDRLSEDPGDFRTVGSRRLSGLVQDLANARVNAAREQSDVARSVARSAANRLIASLGAQPLAQAITGVDMNASERVQQGSQQSQARLDQALQQELRARGIEQTAPLEADVQAADIERQDEIRAQDITRQNRRDNLSLDQQGINALNQAIGSTRNFERQTQLREMAFKQQKELTEFEANEAMKRLMLRLGAETNKQQRKLFEKQRKRLETGSLLLQQMRTQMEGIVGELNKAELLTGSANNPTFMPSPEEIGKGVDREGERVTRAARVVDQAKNFRDRAKDLQNVVSWVQNSAISNTAEGQEWIKYAQNYISAAEKLAAVAATEESNPTDAEVARRTWSAYQDVLDIQQQNPPDIFSAWEDAMGEDDGDNPTPSPPEDDRAPNPDKVRQGSERINSLFGAGTG